jgi:hypothetical protein
MRKRLGADNRLARGLAPRDEADDESEEEAPAPPARGPRHYRQPTNKRAGACMLLLSTYASVVYVSGLACACLRTVPAATLAAPSQTDVFCCLHHKSGSYVMLWLVSCFEFLLSHNMLV